MKKWSLLGRSLGASVGAVVCVLALVLASVTPAHATVSKGDVNGDGVINLADVICLIDSLFIGTCVPVPCRSGQAGGTAEVNKDGLVNIADVIYLINFLFAAGPPPIPAPPAPC